MADYTLQKLTGMADGGDLPIAGGRWELTTDPPIASDQQVPLELIHQLDEVLLHLAAGGFKEATIKFSDLQKEYERMQGITGAGNADKS